MTDWNEKALGVVSDIDDLDDSLYDEHCIETVAAVLRETDRAAELRALEWAQGVYAGADYDYQAFNESRSEVDTRIAELKKGATDV